MLIEVTAEDIEKGERCNPYRCPIARAVNRHTGWQDIRADLHIVSFRADAFGARDYRDTPEAVAVFIDHYDEGWPVEPFSFELSC